MIKRCSQRVFCILLVYFFAFCGLAARERFSSTAGMIRQAPHVVHVRVESQRVVPGLSSLREYTVTVLENFKGKIASSIRVRIFHASHLIDSNRRPEAVGSEMVLVLGLETDAGFYPLRSLHWGKIDVRIEARTGVRRLARPVSGFGKARGRAKVVTLGEFRALCASLRAR